MTLTKHQIDHECAQFRRDHQAVLHSGQMRLNVAFEAGLRRGYELGVDSMGCDRCGACMTPRYCGECGREMEKQ